MHLKNQNFLLFVGLTGKGCEDSLMTCPSMMWVSTCDKQLKLLSILMCDFSPPVASLLALLWGPE